MFSAQKDEKIKMGKRIIFASFSLPPSVSSTRAHMQSTRRCCGGAADVMWRYWGTAPAECPKKCPQPHGPHSDDRSDAPSVVEAHPAAVTPSLFGLKRCSACAWPGSELAGTV